MALASIAAARALSKEQPTRHGTGRRAKGLRSAEQRVCAGGEHSAGAWPVPDGAGMAKFNAGAEYAPPPAFSLFRTRMTTFYAYRVETGPYFFRTRMTT